MTNYEIAQGPQWLADLLVDPPLWVLGVLVGLTVVCLGFAGVALRRHGLNDDILREQGEVLIIVLSIVAVTQMLTSNAELPYLADVAGGTVGGFAIAKTVFYIYEEGAASGESTPR